MCWMEKRDGVSMEKAFSGRDKAGIPDRIFTTKYLN